VVFGVQELVRGRVSGSRAGSFWDKQARDQLKRENPHMLRDTLVLTVGTLLPFMTLAAVLFEVLESRKGGRAD